MKNSSASFILKETWVDMGLKKEVEVKASQCQPSGDKRVQTGDKSDQSEAIDGICFYPCGQAASHGPHQGT